LRSKYHAPKVHITRRKANITENDKFLSKLVVFWSRRQGNFAALRDSHALRLTSKLVDLRAENANLHFASQNSFKLTHQLKKQEKG